MMQPCARLSADSLSLRARRAAQARDVRHKSVTTEEGLGDAAVRGIAQVLVEREEFWWAL